MIGRALSVSVVLASLLLESCALVPLSEELTGGGERGDDSPSEGSWSTAPEGSEPTPPPVFCGSHTCQAFKVAGIFDVPPCCPADSPSACGSLVADVLGSMLGVPPGCHVLEAAGTADTTCPDLELPSGTGEPAVWPGCQAPNATCGALVDLTSVGGPNLGCLSP